MSAIEETVVTTEETIAPTEETVDLRDARVKERVADFLASGINTTSKVALLEAASTHDQLCEPVGQYVQGLASSITPEIINDDLNTLVEDGLLAQSYNDFGTACYRLTEDPEKRPALNDLLELLSDYTFRTRLIAQLHAAGV